MCLSANKSITPVKSVVYEIASHLKDREEFLSLSEHIFVNPEAPNDQGFTSRIIACLQSGHLYTSFCDFAKAVRVFFKAVQAYAGPTAFGLDQKVILATREFLKLYPVTRRMLEIHCPLLGRNFDNYSNSLETFAEASEETLSNITQFFEIGEAEFSDLLEARNFALRFECPALKERTLELIRTTLGNSSCSLELTPLFHTWQFALQNNDHELKRSLLFNNAPTTCILDLSEIHPGAPTYNRYGFLTFEKIRESFEISKLFKHQGDPFKLPYKTTGFSLYVLDKLLREGYVIPSLDIVCLSDSHAKELAQILNIHAANPYLKTLSLSTPFVNEADFLNQESITILLNSVLLVTQIETISLRSINQINFEKCREALANNRFLRHLSVGNLSAQNAIALADALKENKVLKKLEFGISEPDPNVGIQFAKAVIQHPSLEDCIMSADLNYKGVLKWAKTLAKNRILKTLSLDISSDGLLRIDGLGKAFKENTTLRKLSLNVSEESVDLDSFFDGLAQNNGLKTLTIRAVGKGPNFFSSVKTTGIAAVIFKNPTIQTLDLSWTTLEDAEPIFEALQSNSTIRVLKLGKVNMTDRAVLFLANVFRMQRPIRDLSLTSPLQDHHLVVLTYAIQQNPFLMELALRDHCFTYDALSYYASELANSSVVHLDLNITTQSIPKKERKELVQIFERNGFGQYPCSSSKDLDFKRNV